MVEISGVVSFISHVLIFFGLYFSSFWILVLLNSHNITKRIKSYPGVTILIPAFNEEEGISRTLDSILKLNYKGVLNCFVINDCSQDNTLKIAKTYENKSKGLIKVLDRKKNAGKAAALNYGMKLVKTEYIAVVDADSVVSPDSLKNAVKHFYTDDNQKVGAVISKMKPDNLNKNLLERVQVIEYMMVGLVRMLSAKIGLLHLTPGVLSVYNAKILKKLGGFDSSNMTEDFESAVRVRKAGYLIDYSYESEVFTTTPNKFGPFIKQRIRWSRGFIQTHSKHKDIFFRLKYGLFGIYQFPMNVIGPILYFLGIFAISFKIYKEVYKLIYKLIVAPDTIGWFSFDNLKDYFLTIDPKLDFIIIVSFIFFTLFLWSSVKFYKHSFRGYRLKNLFAFVVYIMFYNYIYIYVWIVSVYRELKGHEYSWGRVLKDE